MNRNRVRQLLATGTAAVFVVAGCGSDDSDSDAASADTEASDEPASSDTTPQTEVPDTTDETTAESAPPDTTEETEPVESAATSAADEPDDTEPEADAPTSDGGSATGVAAAGCDEWIEADIQVTALFNGGQGDPESVNAAIDQAIAATDDDISGTITELQDLVQSSLSDPEVEPPEELFDLYDETVQWAATSCDVATLDVVGVDYGYGGMPLEVDAGYTIVNFENQGEELHEMFVVRYNDDTTETLDELLALPQDQVFTKVTPINVAFAPPGTTGTASMNFTEPGTYAVVCAIPVGTVGEAEGDGPPHFAEGMFQEFTVS